MFLLKIRSGTFNWTIPLMIDHMQDNSIPGVPMIHILQIHILTL